MAQTIKKYLNDSFAARWAALILIALAMFFAYMFVDVMSPLQSLVESSRGWGSSVFGTYAASEPKCAESVCAIRTIMLRVFSGAAERKLNDTPLIVVASPISEARYIC